MTPEWHPLFHEFERLAGDLGYSTVYGLPIRQLKQIIALAPGLLALFEADTAFTAREAKAAREEEAEAKRRADSRCSQMTQAEAERLNRQNASEIKAPPMEPWNDVRMMPGSGTPPKYGTRSGLGADVNVPGVPVIGGDR